MIGQAVLLGVLILLSVMDIKKGELPVVLMGITGGAGLLILRAEEALVWADVAGGVCIGGALLLCSFAANESIGQGDALLFCMSGVYLGLWPNLMLFFTAVVFCALAGMTLMILRKCTRKQKIPFVPFVLAADVVLSILRIRSGIAWL